MLGVRLCLSENTAVDFVQGGLAAEAAAQVEEHLDTCCDCRRFVAAVGQVMSADEEADGAPATGGPGADGPPAAMEPLARGTAVGRYRVLGPIGAGAMGVVYAAWDAEMEREVALKLLRPAPGCLAADDRMRARLLREAQALARLTHPHVVTAYDVGTHAGGVFVAMELVSGTTLRQWLAERPRQWREVLAVFLQAGAGLAAAHAVGLVHRDFKPDNVIVDGQGRARVVDFGLARLTGEDSGAPAASGDDAASDGAAGRLRSAVLTGAGARVGTPAYMAPEQHLGQRVDPRTDQFSFCVALHEGLYGTRPARAGSDAATEEARLVVPARQAPSPSGVPARLRRVLQRGLCAAPDDRYPSMDTLLFALGRSARPRWRWALALTALVVLAGAAGLGYRGHVVRARQACATDARAQAAVWNEAQKQRIRDAFQATGAAEWERSFRGVVDRIDAYTAKWVVARTEACEATRRGQSRSRCATCAFSVSTRCSTAFRPWRSFSSTRTKRWSRAHRTPTATCVPSGAAPLALLSCGACVHRRIRPPERGQRACGLDS